MKYDLGVFQTLEATDENDLDCAIPVFRLGTHNDNEEEDRNERVGTYRGIRVIGWLLELENFESDSRNLEIHSVANRKPMQLRKKFEFG